VVKLFQIWIRIYSHSW